MDEFKVGDKVWSVELGWGVVADIVEDDRSYQIFVTFDDKREETFTKNGCRHDYYERTLFFEEILIPESALKRPWEPEKGEWIAVSYTGSVWSIRKFREKDECYFICDSTSNNAYEYWTLAKPLTDFINE